MPSFFTTPVKHRSIRCCRAVFLRILQLIMARALVAALAASAVATSAAQNSSCTGALNLYGGSYHSSYINGTSFNLSAYQGRVLLM